LLLFHTDLDSQLRCSAWITCDPGRWIPTLPLPSHPVSHPGYIGWLFYLWNSHSVGGCVGWNRNIHRVVCDCYSHCVCLDPGAPLLRFDLHFTTFLVAYTRFTAAYGLPRLPTHHTHAHTPAFTTTPAPTTTFPAPLLDRVGYHTPVYHYTHTYR